MSPSNRVFSTFALISSLLVCIPFYWHLQAWNTGTCLYMAWVGVTSFILFINSIIWNGNTVNWAPVWCDISTRILVGAAVAIPAVSLCINRRLYCLSKIKMVEQSRAQKLRAVMVDLAIGLGIPLVQMILQYIVQGHRFDIFEDIGCLTFTYNTPLAFVLVMAPPLILGLISAVYCALTILFFYRQQSQMKRLFSSNGTNMTSSRYLRLICLAGTDVLLSVPYSIYAIYANATQGEIAPWISWEDTHSGFSRVDEFPAREWRRDPAAVLILEVDRWTFVLLAIIFFAFFGFSEEAMIRYRTIYSGIEGMVMRGRESLPRFRPSGKSDGSSSQTTTLKEDEPDSRSRRIPSRYDSVSLKDVGGLLDDCQPKSAHSTHFIPPLFILPPPPSARRTKNKPLPLTPMTTTSKSSISMYSASSAPRHTGDLHPPSISISTSPPAQHHKRIISAFDSFLEISSPTESQMTHGHQ